jgi:uncharacterized protein YicC (UPF0701 family)
MIHSMTGYAVQMRDIGRGVLHLELRTVNSRYLDMNFRIAEEVRIVEPALRELISGPAQPRQGRLPAQPAALHGGAARGQPQPRPAAAAGRPAGRGARPLPEAAPLSVAEVLRWPGMLGDDQLGADTLQAECAALAKAPSTNCSPPAPARARSWRR